MLRCWLWHLYTSWSLCQQVFTVACLRQSPVEPRVQSQTSLWGLCWMVDRWDRLSCTYVLPVGIIPSMPHINSCTADAVHHHISSLERRYITGLQLHKLMTTKISSAEFMMYMLLYVTYPAHSAVRNWKLYSIGQGRADFSTIFKTPGSRTVAWSRFHTEHSPSKILAATAQNSVATAFRVIGFVRPSLEVYFCTYISRTVG
jgi:hypothetical protein